MGKRKVKILEGRGGDVGDTPIFFNVTAKKSETGPQNAYDLKRQLHSFQQIITQIQPFG